MNQSGMAREGRTRFIAGLRAFTSVDPRSLAVFRVALGSLLFFDAARRYPDIEAHYANTGWLANHFALFRPMSQHLFSLYLTCSSPGQVKALWAIQLLIDVGLIVGYRTRWMQVLALVLLTSLNSRNILLESGGGVVLTLLTLWTVFLPLGRRFSVDALLRSLRTRREDSLDELAPPLDREATPITSLAVLALVLQWSVIYGFNFWQKNGVPWHDGTAVYYVLHQHGMVTPLGAWLGGALPLGAIHVLTFSALAIEGAVALLLLVPTHLHVTRPLAGFLVCVLHLSIAATLHLATFSWAMMIPFFALIPSQAWRALRPWLSARRPERILLVNAASAVALAVCRVVKRLDLLDKVRFQAGNGKSFRRFCVVDPSSERTVCGLRAFDSLSEALPLGRATVIWTHLPFVTGALKTWLRRVERKPEYYAAFFELTESLTSKPFGASRARQLLDRIVFFAGEAVLVVLIICCGSQVLIENPIVPACLSPTARPEWMTAVIEYPRLFQGWTMFAPSPPLDDVALVVDGRTADGRHFDPLTGGVPSFEVSARTAAHSKNCEWYYFERRLSEARFKPYLNGVREFLMNHHQLTGRPQDKLVAFDVWSVSEPIARPGEPRAAATKTRILSLGVVQH